MMIVRSTVPILKEHGNAITLNFYDTMIKDVPELNNIFNRASQANGHQAGALAGALYAYASHIDDLGALSPTVEKICQKHASLYIQPEHYKVVGEYLLQAMGTVLGAALTPEILEAWGAAYWQLANIMINREAQLSDTAPNWTNWRDFQITNKFKESDEITSFYLQPLDNKPLPTFLPGQYTSIQTDVPSLNYLQCRHYSLSDAPNPSYYRISVKREAGVDPTNPDHVKHPGYVSNILHDAKNPGDVIKVSHPRGEFFYSPSGAADHPIVLLSAGIGITPMLSILNTHNASGSKQPVSFIHGARTTASRAFHRHAQYLADRHEHVKYTAFIKSPDTEKDVEGEHYHHRGRLSLGKLDREKELFVSDDSTQYFVCGPETFMTEVEKGLMEMGVEQSRIHMEMFGSGVMARS
ncbi:hypothetical protein LTR09_006086 [Extremus antarcticus]|uniref:nitric oxide dioxygenase n=1 Tax=Extremus antarcticus TaxID=702011 RepID=A0AAJ0DFD6_9PEZI|nr:hypothetical protein LTR09_006086 [Extremus antarcticus]